MHEIDLNKAWDCFKNILKSVIDKHVPVFEKKVTGRDCPWLSNEIKAKMNERDHYLRKARKSAKELDWSTYRRLRNNVTRKGRFETVKLTIPDLSLEKILIGQRFLEPNKTHFSNGNWKRKYFDSF